MTKRELLSLVVDRVLFWLSVPKCVGCGEFLEFREPALCPKCKEKYAEQKSRICSRCNKKINECFCSNFYLEKHHIKKLAKVYRYFPFKHELPGNLLIYSLKHDNRRDTVAFLADELSESIKSNIGEFSAENFVITNVPRRKAAIREDGYDHAEVLAKAISKILGIKYEKILVNLAKKSQKKTQGIERAENAKFNYARRRSRLDLRGKTVIIIDDVVTTGSSIGYCASLLKGLRPKEIIGATISIAYKDSYIKPES